jgi:D-hexose-6-phosphate mutarotase
VGLCTVIRVNTKPGPHVLHCAQVHDDATGSVVELERSNLPDAVVWNPWVDKAASMSDFGDEEYKVTVLNLLSSTWHIWHRFSRLKQGSIKCGMSCFLANCISCLVHCNRCS